MTGLPCRPPQRRAARGFYARPRQRGFSLVELLVAMAIGLVIVGAVIVMYLVGNSAVRSVQAQAQMNEDAQMALSALTQELRLAGYNPLRSGAVKNDLGQSGWGIVACDNGFVDDKVASMDLLACATSAGSAAVAVAYEADGYAGRLTSDGKLRDCGGAGIAAASGGFFAVQARLGVVGGALRCRGNGDGFVGGNVLAENIDSIALTFALTDPGTAGTPEVRG